MWLERCERVRGRGVGYGKGAGVGFITVLPMLRFSSTVCLSDD